MFRLVFVFAACAALCFGGNADAGCRSSQAGCLGHQAKATGCAGYQAQGCTSAQAGCSGHHGGGLFHGRLFHRHRATVSIPSAQIAVPANPPQPMPKTAPAAVNRVAIFGEASEPEPVTATLDALAEVNQARARRGLRPFQRDEGLMAGALKCAEYRAARRMAGHTSNDFAFLPAGVTATVGGCSGLEPSLGFQSCAMYEHWTYAGAASVKGPDGRLYHQLFAR